MTTQESVGACHEEKLDHYVRAVRALAKMPAQSAATIDPSHQQVIASLSEDNRPDQRN
jgi:hypothetical protein